MKPQFDLQKPEPKAVKWFRIYCITLAFLHVLYIPAGFYVARVVPRHPNLAENPELVRTLPGLGLTLIVMGVIFGVGFLSAMSLPAKPASYGVALTTLLLGLCCCFPLAIPILLLWLKPEVKEYYNTQ